MEKNKYQKYCKYYKGEEIPPEIKYTDFWYLERDYVRVYNNNPQFRDEDYRSMCFECFPKVKDFINSFNYEFVQKMLANFVVYRYSHNPQGGIDFIFDYGK